MELLKWAQEIIDDGMLSLETYATSKKNEIKLGSHESLSNENSRYLSVEASPSQVIENRYGNDRSPLKAKDVKKLLH